MSDYIINYKAIKNWYARINKDGILELSVPNSWKKRPDAVTSLLNKAKSLENRYADRKIPSQLTEEGVYLFGEWVEWIALDCTAKTSLPHLKTILYDYSKPILDDYAQRIGKKYDELTIKKSKTKWWSCTHDQKINLNLELVHLPTRLIIYVIIHEACHLKVKNHSPRFRELVAIYCPNYKMLRKELRMYILK